MILIGGWLGFAIGAVLGLTGAGGGIFAVPALVFGLGMDMRTAAPVALLAVAAAASVGALQGLRQGIVRYRAAAVLAGAGTLTAPLGVALAHRLPASWLEWIFAGVMLLAAYRMYASSRAAAAQGTALPGHPLVCKVSPDTGRFVWTARTIATFAAVGAVSGLFTGLLGVGGGFIIVPALAFFSELRMHSIVATSLMVIALLSMVSVVVAWSHGVSFTAPAWAFASMALAGMLGGRFLAAKIPPPILQRIFSLACVAVAAMMLARGIG